MKGRKHSTCNKELNIVLNHIHIFKKLLTSSNQ